jgi:hypothetical protein
VGSILTTIRLPPDLHEKLRRRAFEERRPMAELVREAVESWLARDPTAAKRRGAPDPFADAIGSVPGGPADESVAHDRYLYGTTRRPRGRARKPK